jgi:hypothetical protein
MSERPRCSRCGCLSCRCGDAAGLRQIGDELFCWSCAEAEIQRLRDALTSLASFVTTVRRENTHDWMFYIADSINEACRTLGDEDRFEYDGRDMIQKRKDGCF